LRSPKVATHWSARRLAKEVGLSSATVHRIWQKYGLQPHRVDTFKFSHDPEFDSKLADIVGLYLDPPERALVLCVDEQSQVQALDRSQPVLAMLPGMPERRTHDDLRNGVTSLFAALDIATGQVIGSLHRRHRSIEFKQFLAKLDQEVPTDLDVHLVCDNDATPKTETIQRWLATRPRFQVHFVPTSSSWLNQVERWFAELTTKLLQRGVHTSVPALEADIRAWMTTWNQDPKPFVWTKTADEILSALARYCQRISGAGH
jgi:transposase